MHNLLLKLKTLAYIVLAMFFSLIWVLALLLHGWASPFPRLSPQKPLLLAGLALLVFIFFMLINRASFALSKTDEKKFISRLLLSYTLLQISFILLFPVNAYEDARIVNNIALQFLEGDYNALGVGNYLGYYPNNIGITIFISFVYMFLPKSYITLRIINAVFNTITAWLIYKLYRELYPEKREKACGILLLAVTFVPPVILNNFTYGDILCNTFCLAAILNALRFTKYGRGKYAAYTAILLMSANFMRSVALLFLAAVIFYWLINFRAKIAFTLKNLAYAILTILIFNLPIKIFSFAGLKAGIISEPVGMHANPVWRWINMGFPGKKLGYWDGGRNIAIFVNRFKCNKHDAAIFFINELLNNYRITGVANVLKAYTKKIFWLWTEGTYSVNYYGLSQAVGADRFMLYSTPLLKLVEPWDKTARLSLDWMLHSYNWLIIGLAGLYLFDAVRKKDFRLELFVYVIFLYISFYLLWEVKSRYIFGVYPILLIMSYCYSERIYCCFFDRYSKINKIHQEA